MNGVNTLRLFFPEGGEDFPNQLLGAPTLERLRHGAYGRSYGESYRAPRPFPEKPKNAIAKGGEKPFRSFFLGAKRLF
jgi:hypothetical protein